MSARLRLRPIPLREANAFVAEHHRHHGPARGCVFSIGCLDRGRLCGVAIVGRPVARHVQDGATLEIVRHCTDSTPHAASKLYAAAAKACFAVGVQTVCTYLLDTECGVSAAAAGFVPVKHVRGETWHRDGRMRREPMAEMLGLGPKFPEIGKWRWERWSRPDHARAGFCWLGHAILRQRAGVERSAA